MSVNGRSADDDDAEMRSAT